MTDHLFREYKYSISREEKCLANKHKPLLILFTGLSASGKSTIANALEQKLFVKKIKTVVLDGDNIRKGINKDLGFSPKEITENIRRVSEISKLFLSVGIVVLAAFITPRKKDRELIRDTVLEHNYVEVFMNVSLKECQKRDNKGLYRKAKVGEITNVAGISAPYETPIKPDLEISEVNAVEESVEIVYDFIKDKLKL